MNRCPLKRVTKKVETYTQKHQVLFGPGNGPIWKSFLSSNTGVNEWDSSFSKKYGLDIELSTESYGNQDDSFFGLFWEFEGLGSVVNHSGPGAKFLFPENVPLQGFMEVEIESKLNPWKFVLEIRIVCRVSNDLSLWFRIDYHNLKSAKQTQDFWCGWVSNGEMTVNSRTD